MAGAAIDMYEDPEIIAKAKAEMEGGAGWRHLSLPDSGRMQAESDWNEDVKID